MWIKTLLVQAAWAAMRVKDSYLNALFHRIKRRGSSKKAIVAVASSMLRAAYYMLRDGTQYRDLGAAHFTTLDHEKLTKKLLRQLADLGHAVQLKPAA